MLFSLSIIRIITILVYNHTRYSRVKKMENVTRFHLLESTKRIMKADDLPFVSPCANFRDWPSRERSAISVPLSRIKASRVRENSFDEILTVLLYSFAIAKIQVRKFSNFARSQVISLSHSSRSKGREIG